jgi:hypothetical protein
MFVGMVLPGDQLNVKTRHIGMRDGNMAVKIETFNDRGEKVLDGTAEGRLVFTGQGPRKRLSLRRHQGSGYSSTVHGHELRRNGQGRKC